MIQAWGGLPVHGTAIWILARKIQEINTREDDKEAAKK
jgi:hypothetical protein